MATYKGKTTNRSWQNLPPELIRLIATHTLLITSTLNFTPKRWEQREQWMTRMTFNVVREADVLEQLMNVCPSWWLAIETHLFWQHATAVLDPHDLYMDQARMTRLSPFTHFRTNVLQKTCIPCRLNAQYPNTGFGIARRAIYTPVLGYVHCCKDHRKERICGLCLRDATDETVAENEDHDTWPQVDATCKHCRAEALWRACETNRDREAIGGINMISQDWETRQAVESFLEVGEGAIRNILSLAHDKHWLRKNTKIAEMLSLAVATSRFQTRTEEGYESEDEFSDTDPEEEDPELMSMTEDAGGVRDLAINDWARNRILDGHWYSPADQWQVWQSSGNNRPLNVVPAIHPCPWNMSPVGNEEEEHPTSPVRDSEVPPSFVLCQAAWEAFRKQMRALLLPPMVNLVRKIVIECMADGVDPCVKAAKYDVEDVARELRDDGVWYNGIDWLQRRQNSMRELREKERLMDNDTPSDKKDETDDSSTSSKSDGSHTTSPVLSTTTLQTTPSPPPSETKKVEQISHPTPAPIITTALPIAISPVLVSPTLIPSIPYVPLGMSELPPFTIETFKGVWREACAPLYQCRCTICERAVMKANIEAGNIVPSQPTATAPPPPITTIHIPAAGIQQAREIELIDEDEVETIDSEYEEEEDMESSLVVTPHIKSSSPPARRPKRSSADLDVVEDDDDRDTIHRSPSPPKRAKLESPRPDWRAERMKKRGSEEADMDMDVTEGDPRAESKRKRTELPGAAASRMTPTRYVERGETPRPPNKHDVQPLGEAITLTSATAFDGCESEEEMVLLDSGQ